MSCLPFLRLVSMSLKRQVCDQAFFLKGGMTKMEDIAWKQELDPDEDAQICPNCGRVYVVIGTTEDVKNNTFGYIRCLSCDMFTEI